MREYGSFWDNHSQQGMNFLNATLLITPHGITVINTHAFNAVNTRFKGQWVTEFTATVSQTGIANVRNPVHSQAGFLYKRLAYLITFDT